VLRSFPATITAPIVHTHPFYHRRYIILPTDSVIKQHTARYSISTVGIWNKYSLTSTSPPSPMTIYGELVAQYIVTMPVCY